MRRACTCGATEAIQAVFEAGEQVSKNDYVCAAVEDMTYFVERHVQRIEEYRRFADELLNYLRIQDKTAPDLKPYLAKMIQIVQQISTEYNVQKENMKSLDYARELAKKTVTLAGARSPENVQAYLQLGKDWRAMGGAQDYVLAQCHAITRKLFQEAGYGVATQPHAADLAQEIRARARRVLRNPDGYEIWANY